MGHQLTVTAALKSSFIEDTFNRSGRYVKKVAGALETWIYFILNV